MEEDKDKEDFGTKNCNRCGVVFKRKNRFNFFCPTCARHNENESVPRVGTLSIKAGYSPPAT